MQEVISTAVSSMRATIFLHGEVLTVPPLDEYSNQEVKGEYTLPRFPPSCGIQDIRHIGDEFCLICEGSVVS